MADVTVTYSTLPGRLDLELVRGDTFSHSLTWEDAHGAAVDVAGYAADLVVGDAPPGTYTDGTGNVTLGGNPYNVVLSFPPAVTAAFAHGGREWKLVLTDPSGTVTTLLAGTLDAS